MSIAHLTHPVPMMQTSLAAASTPPARAVVTIAHTPGAPDASRHVEEAIAAAADRDERLIQTCADTDRTTLIFAPCR